MGSSKTKDFEVGGSASTYHHTSLIHKIKQTTLELACLTILSTLFRVLFLLLLLPKTAEKSLFPMVANVVQTITFYTLLNTIYGYGVTTMSDDKESSEPSSPMKEAVIFPGTNWCGAGTLATAYSKLGSFGGADKCCRQHDLGCPAYIKTGQTKYGLYNYKLWTLNHCTCDERFRSCLKMVNSARADIVGRFFFNIIRIPCFVFSETEKCTSWTWWGKCINKEKKRHAVLREPMSYRI